jgi:hypothetical protein
VVAMYCRPSSDQASTGSPAAGGCSAEAPRRRGPAYWTTFQSSSAAYVTENNSYHRDRWCTFAVSSKEDGEGREGRGAVKRPIGPSPAAARGRSSSPTSLVWVVGAVVQVIREHYVLD